MEQPAQKKRAVRLCGAVCGILAAVLLALGLTCFLQTGWSHREPRFIPDQTMSELEPVLQKERLTPTDYRLLLQETGLSPAAVEDLRERGVKGVELILETQKGFHQKQEPQCVPLIGGRFTCEDLLRNEKGEAVESVPIAALQAGDLLVSFSTHTLGWRHGHAGLVIDPAKASVLEAVQLGVNSYLSGIRHWQHYSNFMVLRVRNATEELGQKVAHFAKQHLQDVPYSLLAGLLGEKDRPVEEGPGVHCAYLPWYAWEHESVDLDANGGAIVTVGDLARSAELEVVQVYGMDPELVEDRICGL